MCLASSLCPPSPDIDVISNTILAHFGSLQRDLKRRHAEEQKRWPIRLETLPDTAAQDAVLEAIKQASLWLHDATKYWAGGGVAARYNLQTRRYQGPYPETTGYIIPTLLHLAESQSDPSLRTRAIDAGQWLRARQNDTGAVRCNIDGSAADEAKPDKVILFDCGAILQGFSALARLDDRVFRDAAIGLGRFLCASQKSDGLWDDYLYFPTIGTHNSLVAYALIDAADTVGDTDFKDAGFRCLNALRERIHPSGFISGCEYGGDQKTMFLHPYCYTLEGYTKSAMILEDQDLLAVAERALDAMVAQIDRTGELPAAYLDQTLSPVRDDTATTGLAQLADLLFKVGRYVQRDDFASVAHRIMNFLRERIESSQADEGTRGGIQASFPIGGGYGPFTINNWTIKYFLDASAEELVAIDIVRG